MKHFSRVGLTKSFGMCDGGGIKTQKMNKNRLKGENLELGVKLADPSETPLRTG